MRSRRIEPHRAARFPLVQFALVLLSILTAPASRAAAQPGGAGDTGFAGKRPVLASACPHGCPWGELGDFVKEAMAPLGYEVILCRNCNRDLGPRLVSQASQPPELGPQDTAVGTTARVDAPVDFGITESGFLAWAYAGRYNYADAGPYANLRLLAKIEDPTYLLAAVKADSPITSLEQIAAQRLPVKILGGGSAASQPALDFYGLTEQAVQGWVGSFTNPIVAGVLGGALEFDLVINELGSPANNPESVLWPMLSQKYELRFLDFSPQLLDQLANDPNLGFTRAVAQWGLLRGIDRPIPTVARSGHALFARDDMPEQAAYDAAKAVDQHRAALKWYIRPYSYDPHSAWKNLDVPLHPGAERYYREMGYMDDLDTPPAGDDAGASTGACTDGGTQGGKQSGCTLAPAPGTAWGSACLSLLAGLVLARRRRRGVVQDPGI